MIKEEFENMLDSLSYCCSDKELRIVINHIVDGLIDNQEMG